MALNPDHESTWLGFTIDNKMQRIDLVNEQYLVGRSPECDIVVNIDRISRRQCKIFWSDDRWNIADLDSRNGTYVNGERTKESPLQHEDVIQFGARAQLEIVFYRPYSLAQQSMILTDDEANPPRIRESVSLMDFTNAMGGSNMIRATSTGVFADNPESIFSSNETSLIKLFTQMGKVLLASEDFNDMLWRVLELTFVYLPADRGLICTYDENTRQITPICSRRGPTRTAVKLSRTVANCILRRKESVLIDIKSDPNFESVDSIIDMNIQSIICAPMYHEGNVLGLIYLDQVSDSSMPFDRTHLDTLSAIAVFAAAGAASVQLREEFNVERDQRIVADNRIHVLLEVAKSLASELETTSLIKLIMQRARDLLEAERCTFFLVDFEKGELYSKVMDEAAEIRIPLGSGLAGHTATSGETLRIDDVYADSRFNREIDLRTGFRTRNMICIPFRNRSGEVIGVTQLLNKKTSDSFTHEDELLMEAFSTHAGVAIENAMLFQKTVDLGNHLQSVLQSITNVVLTLDLHGYLTTANRDLLPIFGVSDETMRSKHYKEWFGDQNVALVDDITRVFNEPKSVYAADYELQADDKIMSANYNIVPLLDFEHAQKGVVVVLEDISKQKRMMNTLGRYMSPSLAQKVLDEDVNRLGGVRQKGAILFADIRGYTSLTERMDATDIVDMLNGYFSVMVDVILLEKGILDKYIGDAFMAVFGVPFPADDDSERACRAALRMQVALMEFNQRRESSNQCPIKIGIGINSDIVVSGNIGSEKRAEYTCIGDGVNLASRLEGVTKQYEVTTLVSEFTLKEIGEGFQTRELDFIRVMGKQQPVRIYELLGEGENDVSADVAEAVGYFATGLSAYRQREWNEAKKQFAVADKLIGDPVSRIFIRRCDRLVEHPPPQEWDGVWDMTSK